MNLPTAPSVSGQDVVRGADGTTCQSAIASGGPYLDIGVLQSQDFYARESAALYGRVVFPIGRRSRRLDCTRLYQLEIERMRMELEILRMGVSLGDDLGVPPEAGNVAPASWGSPSRATPEIVERKEQRSASTEPPADKPSAHPAFAVVVGPSAPTTSTRAPPNRQGGGFFVQTGAFSSPESAADRVKEVAEAAGRDDGSLKLLMRGDTKLYRSLFGPMSRTDAESLCHQLADGCFVSRS